MNDLDRRAFIGMGQFALALAFVIFLPAWTVFYWQAWVFLAVFFGCVSAITFYLMRYDRALLERRMGVGPGAEGEKSQKLIQAVAAFAFVSIFIISALDHRFAWSYVGENVIIAGDFLVTVGLLAVFLVFKENSYTSGTVEIAPDQKVVSTGPYALVRHPMYAGAFVMLIGVPLALDSYWGLLAVLSIMAAIVGRLLEEERFLIKNLPGYEEYSKKVTSRLVPYVW